MTGRSGRRTHADRVLEHLRCQNKALSAYQILEDLRCGAVTEHVDARLAKNIAALSSHSGFKPEHSVIEIRSRCGACRADASTV